MNTQFWKNQYQMPNMHELIGSAAQIITKDIPGQVWFTSLDLTYAFSQLPLSDVTSSHCKYSILYGEVTDTTYRFKTDSQTCSPSSKRLWIAHSMFWKVWSMIYWSWQKGMSPITTCSSTRWCDDWTKQDRRWSILSANFLWIYLSG